MLKYISNTDSELKPNIRGDLEKKLTDLYVFMENYNIFFSKMTFEHNGREIIATVDKEDFTYCFNK